jgi:hypothetical protein
MADEKKISAKEAALAVLKKAEEVIKNSKLAKAEVPAANPDEKEDAKLGEEVESLVDQHMGENPEAEAAEGHLKGHLKLAKFLGRMEHKRGQKKEAPEAEAPAKEAPAQEAPKAE